jgi:hypothetical protein
VAWTDTQRGTLNTSGINVIRNMFGGSGSTAGARWSIPNTENRSGSRSGTPVSTWPSQLGQRSSERRSSSTRSTVQGKTISAFNSDLKGMLMDFYNAGDLYGATPEEAFSVDTGAAQVNTPATLSQQRTARGAQRQDEPVRRDGADRDRQAGDHGGDLDMPDTIKPIRQDTRSVTVTIFRPGTDIPIIKGIWDKKSGGQMDSEETVYHPGGMADPVSLGGRQERREPHAVAALPHRQRLAGDPAAHERGGQGEDVTVTDQPLDFDGNVQGINALTYAARSSGFTPPDADSEERPARDDRDRGHRRRLPVVA